MDESELNAQGLHDDRKREVADLRRLVEEAQQRSATWQHNHEDALRAAEEARADAKRNALSNIELRIERDRLKGELAEARRLLQEHIAGQTCIPCGRCLLCETMNFLSTTKRAASPADAATESRSVQRRKAAQKSEPAPVFVAPPVSGDGVETKRTMPWPKPACSVSLPCGGCFTRGICDQLMWESGEAAGIACGRALGAREEREALVGIISDRMKRCGHRTGTCRSCMEDGAMIEIIEARRAGRGTP